MQSGAGSGFELILSNELVLHSFRSENFRCLWSQNLLSPILAELMH